jgi:hypothetical protein
MYLIKTGLQLLLCVLFRAEILDPFKILFGTTQFYSSILRACPLCSFLIAYKFYMLRYGLSFISPQLKWKKLI